MCCWYKWDCLSVLTDLLKIDPFGFYLNLSSSCLGRSCEMMDDMSDDA